MKINSIGIIGNGFVGNALYINFKDKYKTLVYDSNPVRSLNSLEETLNSEMVFICLPTPMVSAEGGECNLSIINNFFVSLPKNLECIFVIKSTVPVGTTTQLKSLRPDLKIIHNPEFLTAANAANDFKNSYRNVIGGDKKDAQILVNLLQEMFPKAINIVVSSDESEMIKYFANTFLTTKVAYFNMMYDLCEKYGANYYNVVDGVCSDTRIGYSHSKVPGPDGDRGFGGTCFPKDINSLIHIFEQNNLNCDILKEIWNYNKQIRNNWDWTNSKSAVLNKE
jgi:UDPglucose 6-dehydrogenase